MSIWTDIESESFLRMLLALRLAVWMKVVVGGMMVRGHVVPRTSCRKRWALREVRV